MRKKGTSHRHWSGRKALRLKVKMLRVAETLTATQIKKKVKMTTRIVLMKKLAVGGNLRTGSSVSNKNEGLIRSHRQAGSVMPAMTTLAVKMVGLSGAGV